MVPSKLNVTGFDDYAVYFRTVEGQEVFAEWRELPIGEALSHDAVRTAAEELHEIRGQAVARGMEAIEKALTVVTAADERKKLQEAFDSLAEGRRTRLVEQD